MGSDKAPTTSGMKGKFTYVGLDIDTTGRRLIDEIVNIAAYTPNAQFSQHIMPLMNLNPGARQRHLIRVINVGCFRMLKSMQTYKVIKTKTEIAALLDFLDWIEAINTNDGIIFVYHDQLKFTPFMVIEAMKKYRLLERFEKTVKSFVNGYDLTDEKRGGEGIKYLNLQQNYKVQTEKLGMEVKELNEFEGDATVRAKLSYEIITLMSHGGEKKDVDDKAMAAILNEFVRAKAMPITDELEEISEQEECIKRQSTLRDIFRGFFQTSRYHRRRAVTFRRLLAEAKQDMESLTKIWTDSKRDGIAEMVKKIEGMKEDETEELIDILDSHFDPEKKAIKPVVQRRTERRDSNQNNGNNVNHDNNQNQNNMRNQRNNRRGPGRPNVNKENQGPPRNNSRRRKRSTTDKRQYNNNNVMDSKSGTIRKDQQQQMDANQNSVLVSAN